METTSVSSKYQVVIPQRIRDQLKIQPGQRMQVLIVGNTIQFVPVRPMREYRGIAQRHRYGCPKRRRGPDVNVIDSSAWLEYFADAPNAEFYAEPLEDIDSVIVPTVVIYETYKRLRQQRGDTVAMDGLAAMRQGKVVELDAALAVNAADLSVALHLSMADSIILATTRRYDATLWTQDQHFDGLADVRYFAKK